MLEHLVANNSRRIVRIPEVLSRCGLSRSSVWRLERAGRFPFHVRIGIRAIGWYEHEIDQWLDNRRSDDAFVSLGSNHSSPA